MAMRTHLSAPTPHASRMRSAALHALLFAFTLCLLAAPNAYAESYEIPSDAQASGKRDECTWFIRSATDPEAPGQLVIYPTNGSSGILSWPSLPPWYMKASLIQSAYIAPGVKAGPDMYGFLYRAKNMTYADVSNLDMSGCESIWSFFCGCSALTEIKGVSSWDVSKASNFQNTFKDCSKITSLDLSSWQIGLNSSGEMTLESMFEGCRQLTDIGSTAGWDVSSSTCMDSVFNSCNSLEYVDGLEGWDVSQSKNFYGIFASSGIRRLNLSSWDTSAALDMTNFFSGMNGAAVEYIKLGPLFTFDPVGLQEGEWSPETRTSFPIPSGTNSQGATFTGRWVADESGVAYAASAIPSLTAGTYRPETAGLGSLELTGDALTGKTLTAVLAGSSNVTPAYEWFRASSASGPWTAIQGAQDASYTLAPSDAGSYVKCVVSDASGAVKTTLTAVSQQVQTPALSGSISITGNYEYSDAMLSATPHDTPQDAVLSYTWYAGSQKGALDTPVGEGMSYWPSADHVGKFITCVVTDLSGNYQGEIRFEGECVTATLSLRVPDNAYGLVSADGSISWEGLGEATNQSSCPILVTGAHSTIPGQENAACSLEGERLEQGTSLEISWTNISKADASVYELLQRNLGAYVNAGTFVYEFEPAPANMLQ